MDAGHTKEREAEVSNLVDTDARQKLQREVAEKREEIAENVQLIRTSFLDEIRERKKALQDALDWKYYVKKQPVAAAGGAAAIGFFIGASIGKRVFEQVFHEEPDWRDRASGYVRSAERKFDEMRGRAVYDESKWKARSRSMVSSGTDLLFRELAKAAQQMIIPTVVAAVTGKMASDNKTTIVEKTVEKTPPGVADREITKGVTQVEDGQITKAAGSAPPVHKADEADQYS